jgi:hypothetical protein
VFVPLQAARGSRRDPISGLPLGARTALAERKTLEKVKLEKAAREGAKARGRDQGPGTRDQGPGTKRVGTNLGGKKGRSSVV